MSGNSIYAWSTTADDNGNADTDINFVEYQAPSTVNNAGRAVMARLAQFVDDLGANVTSSGTGSAYEIATSGGGGTGSYNDGETVEFIPHVVNAGACTLKRDGRGAVPWRPISGTEMPGGVILPGVPIKATYKLATNEWISSVPGYAVRQLAPALLQSQTFGLRVGNVILSLSATPDAGFIRLTEAIQFKNKADYPDLHTWVAGQGYPWGSTSTTFGLPPSAGYMLRFAANNNTIDPSGPRAPGSTQTDMVGPLGLSATTSVTVTNGGQQLQGGGGTTALQGGTTYSQNSVGTVVTISATATTNVTSSTAGVETRSKNVAYHADMLAVPALVASGLIGVAGFAFKWNTSTSTADPGASFISTNNGTIASATELYISETDANNNDFAPILATLPANTGFYITKVGAPNVFRYVTLTNAGTDNGAWRTFAISGGSGSGTLATGDNVTVVVHMAGARGAQGVTGSDGGIRFTYDSTTSMAAPAAGGIRFNAAISGAVSQVAISASNAETGNPSDSAWIKTWDDSTNVSTKGTLVIRNASAPQNWIKLSVTGTVTDNTSWLTFNTTKIAAAGSFTNGDTLLVSFSTAGDKGTDGIGSGTVTSVGLSMPSGFTVSSSPVTGAGTLTVTEDTVSANKIKAGPGAGSPAAPTYRSLVAADLPASGVVAGTYFNPSFTADALGRITSATSGVQITTVTATSYTVQNTDQSKLITVSNTSPIALTLPQAGSGGLFASGWMAQIVNINTGAATLTPTTSTINGLSAIVLRQYDSIIIVSDGTNYKAMLSIYIPRSGAVIRRDVQTYTANTNLTTAIPADDTIPQSTEGTQIMSSSVTPLFASSLIRCRVDVWGTMAGSIWTIWTTALFLNAGADAVAATAASSVGTQGNCVLSYEYAPGSTSAQTLSVRAGPASGTLRLNGTGAVRLFGGVSACTLVVEEVLQ